MFKNMTIQLKLLLLSLSSLVLMAMAISYISIEKSSQALLKDRFDQLSTIEVVKHQELKNYFKELKHTITYLSSSDRTIEAMSRFDSGFDKLSKQIAFDKESLQNDLKVEYNSNYLPLINEDVPNSKSLGSLKEYIPKNINAKIAQDIFIVKNKAKIGFKDSFEYDKNYDSDYMDTHKTYHYFFRKYLKSFTLYDIFLINNDGDIVYTTFKEKDFAANLKTERYKDSGLADVYNKALKLKKGDIAFDDFEPYEPSYNIPTSFIAAPIFKGGKKIGVLAFQLPTGKLNKIMRFEGKYKRAGLGNSGECYLVGSDYNMRTDSRFVKNIDNRVVQKLNSTISVLKIDTKTTQKVFSGDESIGKWIIKDYRGVDVLSVYHAVKPFGQARWAIVVKIDKDEALKPIKDLNSDILQIILLILIFAILINLYLVKKGVISPLYNFRDSLIDFFDKLKTNQTNFNHIDIKNNDEIGHMSSSINDTIVQVQKSLQEKELDIWIKEGIAILNDTFINNTSLKPLLDNGLKQIATYVNCDVAVVYLKDEKYNRVRLKASYSYAYDNNAVKYNFGQSLVGAVAQDKQSRIIINEDNNLKIKSATIEKNPTTVYLYPLIFQDKFYGVLELATLKKEDIKIKKFLQTASRVFATTISVAIRKQKVELLLEESKIQNTRLEEQQQQIEISNTHLEEQQQKLEEANAMMEEQQQQLEVQNQDLKVAQEQLEQRAKELELSSKYKGEFLANMSHELRTPLNAIILLSQLLSKNKKENLTADDIKKQKLSTHLEMNFYD